MTTDETFYVASEKLDEDAEFHNSINSQFLGRRIQKVCDKCKNVILHASDVQGPGQATYCKSCRRITEDMSPEEKERIGAMPEIGEFDVKLIFVRNLGKLHFTGRQFDLNEFLTLPGPVKDLTRDQLMLHIAGLEKSMRLLKAYSQGQLKAFSDEVEPEIAEKHKREEKEKEVKKREAKPKSLSSLIEGSGFNKEQFKLELIEYLKKKKEQAEAGKVKE